MHKFMPGHTVQFRPAARDHYATRGMYLVIKKLPERDGELEYRIKSLGEPHERIARESELRRP
jgi:hypothetical protein